MPGVAAGKPPVGVQCLVTGLPHAAALGADPAQAAVTCATGQRHRPDDALTDAQPAAVQCVRALAADRNDLADGFVTEYRRARLIAPSADGVAVAAADRGEPDPHQDVSR